MGWPINGVPISSEKKPKSFQDILDGYNTQENDLAGPPPPVTQQAVVAGQQGVPVPSALSPEDLHLQNALMNEMHKQQKKQEEDIGQQRNLASLLAGQKAGEDKSPMIQAFLRMGGQSPGEISQVLKSAAPTPYEDYTKNLKDQLAAVSKGQDSLADNKQAELKARLGFAKDNKASKQSDAEFARYEKLVNPNMSSSRSPVGRAQIKLDTIKSIAGMVTAMTPEQFTKVDVKEMSTALANVLTGGTQAAEGLIESLTPSSLHGDMKAMWSYLQNEPKGAGMQKFIYRTAALLDREQGVWSDKIKEEQHQAAKANKHLAVLDPIRYARMNSAYGVPEGETFKPDVDLGVIKSLGQKAHLGAGAAAAPMDYDAWVKAGKPKAGQ